MRVSQADTGMKPNQECASQTAMHVRYAVLWWHLIVYEANLYGHKSITGYIRVETIEDTASSSDRRLPGYIGTRKDTHNKRRTSKCVQTDEKKKK